MASNFSQNLKREIADSLILLEREVIKEMRAQGHRLSGDLLASIELKVIELAGFIAGDFLLYDYGFIVDRGIKADRIPFQPGSGKKKSRYIDALTQFAKDRGLASGDKEARGIAFAIAHKQKREGNPTKGSFQHSTTGRRTDFITGTFNRLGEGIGNRLAAAAEKDLDIVLTNLITKHSKTLSL